MFCSTEVMSFSLSPFFSLLPSPSFLLPPFFSLLPSPSFLLSPSFSLLPSLSFAGLIAEVILYSEGFESSKKLSQKMVQMYKLCSEQLSQQDHYDFGLRALVSVLKYGGRKKRANPDMPDEEVPTLLFIL